eukprot:9417392-Lingulodinium_polyedra.AAC.1
MGELPASAALVAMLHERRRVGGHAGRAVELLRDVGQRRAELLAAARPRPGAHLASRARGPRPA